jgi:hypothetical protein
MYRYAFCDINGLAFIDVRSGDARQVKHVFRMISDVKQLKAKAIAMQNRFELITLNGKTFRSGKHFFGI